MFVSFAGRTLIGEKVKFMWASIKNDELLNFLEVIKPSIIGMKLKIENVVMPGFIILLGRTFICLSISLSVFPLVLCYLQLATTQ